MTAAHDDGSTRSAATLDCGLEVATVGSDTLRATLRIDGSLNERTVALLLSILGTHVRFGRRYIRVDLRKASVDVAGVGAAVAGAHRTIVDLGGMLVFDSADEDTVAGLRGFDLHASPVS